MQCTFAFSYKFFESNIQENFELLIMVQGNSYNLRFWLENTLIAMPKKIDFWRIPKHNFVTTNSMKL